MAFCSSEKCGAECAYVPLIVVLGQRLNTFLVMCKAKPGVGRDSCKVMERCIGGTGTLKERIEVLRQAPSLAPSTPTSIGLLPPRCCLVRPHSSVYSGHGTGSSELGPGAPVPLPRGLPACTHRSAFNKRLQPRVFQLPGALSPGCARLPGTQDARLWESAGQLRPPDFIKGQETQRARNRRMILCDLGKVLYSFRASISLPVKWT